MRKHQHVKRLRFSLKTNKYKYPKNFPLKIACSRPCPKFLFPHRYKTVPSVYNKHLSGPPMPKCEANMNYIPPSPPRSMKQCSYCKISYGTTFDYYDPGAISQWCDTIR